MTSTQTTLQILRLVQSCDYHAMFCADVIREERLAAWARVLARTDEIARLEALA